MSLPETNDQTEFAEGAVPKMVLDDPQQLIGTTILGRFRVDGVLGVGGMGAVLRCHHKGLQRDIAVKVLHPQMSTNPEIAARFAREAHTMSRMNHPNCVRVLDFGEFEVGGVVMQYLAMELLSGCELSALMLRQLPPERSMELMDQVFLGLEHAHGVGVVHRDLKPENVFVTTDHEDREQLKIVDFGIAKIVAGRGAKDNMTVAGTIFGTPRYMSPEQCAGGEIDERTDVYAAGIILYEMLAGNVPFDNPEDPIKVIHQHILAPVPPLPGTVPVPLAGLVMAMLEKEKAKRLPTITAAREAMSQIRRDLVTGAAMSLSSATLFPSSAPVAALPTVPPVRGGGTMRVEAKAKPTWILAGLGAFVVVAGALAYALRGGSNPPPTTPAVAPVSVAAGAPTRPTGATAAPTELPSAFGATAPMAGDDAIAMLDAMLADKQFAPASEKLRRLLDSFPKDARLHLRQARAVRESDGSRALTAYARALELDPELLEQEPVREELLALMRRPDLEGPAIDLAIRRLGRYGIGFLLECVNDEAGPASFADRHRALRTIEDADRDDEYNGELNIALDLWQAKQATDPCAAYGDAMTAIEKEPVAYYIGSVMRTAPPSACYALVTRHAALKEMLLARFQIAEADWKVPAAFAAKKPKKKRSGSGGLLRRMGIR